MSNFVEVVGTVYTIKRHIEYLIPTAEEILYTMERDFTINIPKFQNMLYTIVSLIDSLDELNSQSPLFMEKSGLTVFRYFLVEIFENIKNRFNSRMMDVDDYDEYDDDDDEIQLLKQLLDELKVYNDYLDDIIAKLSSMPQDELTDEHPIFQYLSAGGFSLGFVDKFKKFKQSYEQWYDAIDYDINRLSNIPAYDWYTDNKTITMFDTLVTDFDKYVNDLLRLLNMQGRLESTKNTNLESIKNAVLEIKSHVNWIKQNQERSDSLSTFIQTIKEFKYVLDDIDAEINSYDE